jgi:hypothetical protein
VELVNSHGSSFERLSLMITKLAILVGELYIKKLQFSHLFDEIFDESQVEIGMLRSAEVPVKFGELLNLLI